MLNMVAAELRWISEILNANVWRYSYGKNHKRAACKME